MTAQMPTGSNVLKLITILCLLLSMLLSSFNSSVVNKDIGITSSPHVSNETVVYDLDYLEEDSNEPLVRVKRKGGKGGGSRSGSAGHSSSHSSTSSDSSSSGHWTSSRSSHPVRGGGGSHRWTHTNSTGNSTSSGEEEEEGVNP